MTETLAVIERLANELVEAVAALSRPAEREPEERYLTTEEVAAMLQVSERWVRNHRTKLGGFGTRKMLRFPESAVKRWIERSRK